MHYIFSQNGRDHVVRGGDDMQKALGLDSGGRLVVMTDEQGQLVGTGYGAEKLLKSMPLVEAMRDGSLLKSMRANEPLHKIRIKKPLAKSLSRRQTSGCFDQLVRELDQLRHNMYA